MALAPEAQRNLDGLVKTELSVDRHLVRILDLVATYGKAEVVGAMLHALQYGAYGAEYVENIVLAERRRRREGQKTQLQIKNKDLAEIDLPEQDLNRYDTWLKTDGSEEKA